MTDALTHGTGALVGVVMPGEEQIHLVLRQDWVDGLRQVIRHGAILRIVLAAVRGAVGRDDDPR
eukprot:CAMPEP_0117469980 /NCGR_PEP_ID=MMETSP0784-20121206/6977_1 /TAXON_ID=39447 /ORGANISM="" /LENGTH=63 /DNA_ID=CAMNT_0005264049 /DNA_START=50 /DNA_END=238 /DNA_ORIENTATION=-